MDYVWICMEVCMDMYGYAGYVWICDMYGYAGYVCSLKNILLHGLHAHTGE